MDRQQKKNIIEKDDDKSIDQGAETPDKKNYKGRNVLIIAIVAIVALSIYQSYRSYFSAPIATNIEDYIDTASQSSQDEVGSTDAPTNSTASTNSSTKTTNSTSSSSGSATSGASGTTTAVSQKDNLIEYFLDIALHFGVDRPLTTGVERWVKNPFYVGSAPGTLDQDFSTCLDGFIRDFNSVSSTTKLVRNNELADIKIYVVSPEEMDEYGGADSGWGYAYLFRNSANEDYGGEVFLSTATPSSSDVKCYLIRHEMMHAVGFRGHSDLFWEGIMAVPGVGRNTGNSMNTPDIKAIQMLYNIGLPLKSSEEAARTFVSSHYPE